MTRDRPDRSKEKESMWFKQGGRSRKQDRSRDERVERLTDREGRKYKSSRKYRRVHDRRGKG